MKNKSAVRSNQINRSCISALPLVWTCSFLKFYSPRNPAYQSLAAQRSWRWPGAAIKSSCTFMCPVKIGSNRTYTGPIPSNTKQRFQAPQRIGRPLQELALVLDDRRRTWQGPVYNKACTNFAAAGPRSDACWPLAMQGLAALGPPPPIEWTIAGENILSSFFCSPS